MNLCLCMNRLMEFKLQKKWFFFSFIAMDDFPFFHKFTRTIVKRMYHVIDTNKYWILSSIYCRLCHSFMDTKTSENITSPTKKKSYDSKRCFYSWTDWQMNMNAFANHLKHRNSIVKWGSLRENEYTRNYSQRNHSHTSLYDCDLVESVFQMIPTDRWNPIVIFISFSLQWKRSDCEQTKNLTFVAILFHEYKNIVRVIE